MFIIYPYYLFYNKWNRINWIVDSNLIKIECEVKWNRNEVWSW